MIKYGLISETDARCIEKTIDLICQDFKRGMVDFCEVGVYAGETGNGISQYLASKGRLSYYTGIDNSKDGEAIRFQPHWLIRGNSNEVYNQLDDNSQHLIIIDALHIFPAVVSDFFCYAPKVKKGGYLALHDTGKHIDPLSGWQGVGNKNDPDMCLGGVRKALQAIGLIDYPYWYGEFGQPISKSFPGWELIFDEADINDTGGGVCVFRKI